MGAHKNRIPGHPGIEQGHGMEVGGWNLDVVGGKRGDTMGRVQSRLEQQSVHQRGRKIGRLEQRGGESRELESEWWGYEGGGHREQTGSVFYAPEGKENGRTGGIMWSGHSSTRMHWSRWLGTR